MPAWLKGLLEQLSPEGAGLTMLGALITTVVAAVLRAKHIVAREQRAMQSVPPTSQPTTRSVSHDEIFEALQTRIEQLETLLRREKWRISEFERQATELGQDHAATASALAAERAKTENLERYIKELEGRLRAIEAGHVMPSASLLPVPERITVRPVELREGDIIHVIELDEDDKQPDQRPTPRHGFPKR